MTWLGTMLAGVLVIVLAPMAGSSAQAGSTQLVSGAGSTWVQFALDQWRADIARQGYFINYQSVGSSAGRELYAVGAVDFAASELPFQPEELLLLHNKTFQYVPDVGGGVGFMYNLHTPSGSRITTLRLNADAAGRIFTGLIGSWQDPEIAS